MDAIIAQLKSALGARYTVQRELPGAGMSRVFLADEPALARPVVIKTLAPGPIAEVTADRFRREIALLAGLQHPNIVPLLEGGEVAGFLYYTMPFVEGRSLRERLDEERELPVGESLRLLRELADALSTAHEHGIVHRDLKPENVLLSHGHALLADFGVARALASVAADERLTGTGIALGTPRYAAPEQAAGDAPFDQRADLYALGVIAYEMLTGRHPFEGRHAAAMLAAHATVTPEPVRTWRPSVPPALELLVMRLLEKRPADRPASAAAVLRELDDLAMVAPAGAHIRHAKPARAPGARRRGLLFLIVALVAASGYLTLRRPLARQPAAAVQRGIAVLPFENIGADTAGDYFSDGITEELINALSRIEGVHVAARTSAFALKGRGLDARTIGDTLGVSTLLAGSVRRAGDLLRVRAELVNASNGYTIWSETYERQLRDVFAVQDEIARAIVSRLRLTLPVELRDTAGPKPRLEAYDLYLKGRFYWNRRTDEGLRRSVDLFHASIAQDSTFALAYAALADAYAVLGTYSFIAPTEALPRARAAAERALVLDSTLAEAHAALGFALFWHARDWSAAEHRFRRAIELNPSYPTAYHWYSLMLSALGRHDEAIAKMRSALARDPLSPIISTILGTRYLFAGRTDEALRQLLETRELHPTYPLTLFWLAQTWQYLADTASAVAAAQAAVRSDPTNAMMYLGLGRIDAALGRQAEARRLLDDVQRRFAGRFSPVHVAWVHAALGDFPAGAHWLQTAYEARDGWLNNLAVDPALKPLLEEPRVRELRQRLNLPAR